ncbi:MAG: prolipoprotein diacylglyceryl transferase [Actinomycetia bacterium]|nr:prolipoprotein diacylglyceryl transferase [Actinomycetes bacterium]
MSVDPVAFYIGNLQIRWYGIIIAVGLLLGILAAYMVARYRNRKEEEIINFAPFAVIAGIIGARVLHVVVNWSYYASNPSYIFAFRRGGLAIQGVMLGGLIALAIFCRVRKLSFWTWADIIAPALVLGQAIGRWGNFFNQEAFGLPTDLPWAIYIDPAYRPAAYASSEYFHPTFLYESIANFILFGILLLLHRYYKKRPNRLPDGLIICAYLAIYALYRTFIEAYRVDSTYFGPIKVVYVLNFLAIIAAIIIANYLITRFKDKQKQE